MRKLAGIDLNLLVVLQTLFQERSVTRTGLRLGRTQSAISNALRRLRDLFDDPLFTRTPAGLMPTPKAEKLEGPVYEILAMAEACLCPKAASLDPSMAQVRFRIGAPDRLGLPVMVPFLDRLNRAAPGIAIDFTTTDREPALGLLEDGAIDVAVGWFDRRPSRLNSTLLFEEQLVCLCRRGHPVLEAAGNIGLSALLSYPHLVVSSAGDRKAAFDAILARLGFQRKTAVSVTNFSMVPNILGGTDYLGVFTSGVAQTMARKFSLASRPLSIEIAPLPHYMAWHKRFDADPVHAWMREQLALACEPRRMAQSSVTTSGNP